MIELILGITVVVVVLSLMTTEGAATSITVPVDQRRNPWSRDR